MTTYRDQLRRALDPVDPPTLEEALQAGNDLDARVHAPEGDWQALDDETPDDDED